MPDTVQELLHKAMSLGEDDRRVLAQVLVEAILAESSAAEPVPEWHKPILDERLRDMRENPDDWVSLEQLRAELDKASDAA